MRETPKPVPAVDLKAQYHSLREEIDAAIQRVMEHQQFILGPEVAAFEKQTADYCGTRFAVGVASGTDAIRLALLACGIGRGDEVITTPFTFVATIETIVQCGATPVFADIDPKTCNIDPGKIGAKINSRTRAIMPVHLYGQPAGMEPIMSFAGERKLKVIEDCAQSLGTTYKGKKTGAIGDAGCLSFFPSKNPGAFGDGGMVVTNSPEIADAANVLRKHGARTSYYYEAIGFNSRLDTLQAAVLGVKLKYLDSWIKLRRERAALYNQLLGKISGMSAPFMEGSDGHSFNYYTIRVSAKLGRDKLREYLNERHIQTAIYYPLSLHLQKAYKFLGYNKGDFPESELAQEEVISLPIYPELSLETVRNVAASVREFAERIR